MQSLSRRAFAKALSLIAPATVASTIALPASAEDAAAKTSLTNSGVPLWPGDDPISASDAIGTLVLHGVKPFGSASGSLFKVTFSDPVFAHISGIEGSWRQKVRLDVESLISRISYRANCPQANVSTAKVNIECAGAEVMMRDGTRYVTTRGGVSLGSDDIELSFVEQLRPGRQLFVHRNQTDVKHDLEFYRLHLHSDMWSFSVEGLDGLHTRVSGDWMLSYSLGLPWWVNMLDIPAREKITAPLHERGWLPAITSV